MPYYRFKAQFYIKVKYILKNWNKTNVKEDLMSKVVCKHITTTLQTNSVSLSLFQNVPSLRLKLKFLFNTIFLNQNVIN